MSNYVDNVNILWWLNFLKQEFAFNCKKQNVQIILTWQSVKKCYNSGSRTRIRPSFLFVNIFILYICITLLKDTSNKKVFYVMTLYCYGEKKTPNFLTFSPKKTNIPNKLVFCFFCLHKVQHVVGLHVNVRLSYPGLSLKTETFYCRSLLLRPLKYWERCINLLEIMNYYLKCHCLSPVEGV